VRNAPDVEPFAKMATNGMGVGVTLVMQRVTKDTTGMKTARNVADAVLFGKMFTSGKAVNALFAGKLATKGMIGAATVRSAPNAGPSAILALAASVAGLAMLVVSYTVGIGRERVQIVVAEV